MLGLDACFLEPMPETFDASSSGRGGETGRSPTPGLTLNLQGSQRPSKLGCRAWWRTQRLAAAVDPLGQVVRGLTEPCPVRSAMEATGRPGVWTGRAADHFRGWLQALEVFIVRQLAPAVEDVRKWLVHRAGELEDYERSAAAGAPGVSPPLPPHIGLPGPGTVPGYEPYRGPASGFVGLDPGGCAWW